MLFIALVLAFAATPDTARCEGPSVAVFPIKNNGQAQYTGMASGLSAMITTNLNRSDALDVVEPQAVIGALARFRLTGGAPSVEDSLRAARQLGARYAVTGTFLMFGGKFRIDIRIYDVEKGTLAFADKAQAGEDAFFDKVDELSDGIILKIAGSLPRPKGSLSVDSVPEGADIVLDGEDAGRTPRLIEKVEPGRHQVEIELYGYQPYSETVTVKEGESAQVKAELVPLNGGIRVWWKGIPTSDVQVGGDVVGISNFRFDETNPPRKYCRNMPAGTYRVSARMPYKEESSWDIARVWKTFTEDVEVSPGEVSDVYIRNDLFSPGVEVTVCGQCARSWDFTTDLVWFEQINAGGVEPRPFE